MIVENYPRPEVTDEEYRALEARAMQRILQLPYNDIGRSLIVMDIERNMIRRWIADERLPEHRAPDALANAINDGTVTKLFQD